MQKPSKLSTSSTPSTISTFDLSTSDPMLSYTANWHTHTYRCKHAQGDAADYCAAAVSAGLSVLGFSDHSPMKDGRWSGVRMNYDQMPDYIRAIDEAVAAFPSLKVFKGLECEWVPTLGAGYYADELRDRFGLHYIALAPHAFTMESGTEKWIDTFHWNKSVPIEEKAWLKGYARYVVEAIGTGLFDFVAHPDLLGCFCSSWTAESEAASRTIARAAKDAGMPLEINASGFVHPWVADGNGGDRAPYPWLPFWEVVADEGADVMINTDAHNPANIVANIDRAYEIAEKAGVRVVSAVPLLRM